MVMPWERAALTILSSAKAWVIPERAPEFSIF